MSLISSYPNDTTPSYDDRLIGTDAQDVSATKNITIGALLSMPLPSVPVYANNDAAIAAGLVVGRVYRITGTGQLGVVY